MVEKIQDALRGGVEGIRGQANVAFFDGLGVIAPAIAIAPAGHPAQPAAQPEFWASREVVADNIFGIDRHPTGRRRRSK